MPDLPPPVVHAAAPLRIDLAGSGGLPALALGQPATALTVTLALAARVEIRLGGRTIRLGVAEPQQHVTLASPSDLSYDGLLDQHKAALNMLPVTGGLEMLTRGDAPDAAGLGSRAAINLAILAALARCRREVYDSTELAGLAVSLQETELGRSSVRLDTWAVALGGPRVLATDGGGVTARPAAAAERGAELEKRVVLVPLDRSRAGGIRQHAVVERLATGDRATADAVSVLEDSVLPAAGALEAGDWGGLVGIFQQVWPAQLQLDPVLAAAPARGLQDRLRAAGALAWKVTSGGRGGTLVVLCEADQRVAVAGAARDAGCVVLAAAPGAGVRVWEEDAAA